MHYQLYYWTGLQGRGKSCDSHWKMPARPIPMWPARRGDEVMTQFLEGKHTSARPFAPPFLKAGDVVVAQVAAILHFMGPHLILLRY